MNTDTILISHVPLLLSWKCGRKEYALKTKAKVFSHRRSEKFLKALKVVYLLNIAKDLESNI